MKKKKFFLIFLVTSLLLSGCWDANEPERMLYVQGAGIDYKDGKYLIYLQFTNPALIAKTESIGTGSETKRVVAHGSGRNINEAMFNIYSSMQRRLFWGHISFIVLTENALKKEGLKKAIDQFDRYRETRYNIYFYATKEPLAKLLTTVPPLELSSYFSRLSDPKASYEQRSIVQPINLRELLIGLNEPPHEVIIPYVRLASHEWESDAGTMDVIQEAGAALLTRDDVKIIKYQNAKGLTWLNKELTRGEITLPNKLSDVSLIIDEVKIKKKQIHEGTAIHFELAFEVAATLSEIGQDVPLAEIEKSAEKILLSEVQRTYLEGIKYDADIYRLSEEVYRKKVKVWKEIEQHGKIPLSKDSLKKITVNVTVIHGEKQRSKPSA